MSLALLPEEWQEARLQVEWLGWFLFSPPGRRPSQLHNFARFFSVQSLIWGLYASGVGIKVQ